MNARIKRVTDLGHVALLLPGSLHGHSPGYAEESAQTYLRKPV